MLKHGRNILSQVVDDNRRRYAASKKPMQAATYSRSHFAGMTGTSNASALDRICCYVVQNMQQVLALPCSQSLLNIVQGSTGVLGCWRAVRYTLLLPLAMSRV
eukprot:GHRR01032513.1.p2 GENE.GHRR01032513.1~~GHRR01032513.1.p2  ORF type:complete len:103 (-),score=33.19 GHRR01032513.1:70-378(-)